MISGLSQLLGLNATAAPAIHPRQVDLSGNIFHFSMPENFSRDMPAANMVEKLDIEDLRKFNDPQYGNIIRRWWDIKKPGFFGKEVGTVMMDISVQRVSDNKQNLVHNKPYDITDRLDFITMIYDHLHQTYDHLNIEAKKNYGEANAYHFGISSLIGDQLRSHYRDYSYNGQKWTGYTVSAPSNQLIVGFVMPLTRDTYLELMFIYSPNQNISSHEFLEIADKTTQPIEDSLRVSFTPNNTIRDLVENSWLNITNNETLAQHKDKILIPLFGPDIHIRMEESNKQALKLQKELDHPLGE
jgi:hypothetical protein